jgi:hypothetical protein
MSTRNVLTVFIASPSDLADERQTAFEVVANVNRILKKLNWQVDLLGWEERLSGYGRPQAQINADVDRCELFIGLLWRRWGTPPGGDSQFTSGFEEEFTLARRRREASSTPEMWMFFKDVDPGQLTDPGQDLRRVLAFQESLVAGKTILFKSFGTLSEWEETLRDDLLQYVIELSSVPHHTPEKPPERGVEADVEEQRDKPIATAEDVEAGRQIATLVNALEPSFKDGDLSKVFANPDDGNENAFWAVRSALLSAALLARTGSAGEPIGTHELNTLYKYRERLRPTRRELSVLFESFLRDESDVKPGWYWFRTRNIARQLTITAMIGHDPDARKVAFRLLRQTKIVDPEFRDDFIRAVLPDITADVQDEAWDYLAAIATPDDIDVLRVEAADTWLAPRLSWLASWVSSGRSLDLFLRTSPDPQLIPNSMNKAIANSISQLSDDTLAALSSMPLGSISQSASTELNVRTKPSATRTAREPRRSGLSFGLAALERVGQGESDEQVYARLSLLDSSMLNKLIDWYSNEGPIAYRLLAERGDISRDTVRADLSQGFERVLRDSEGALKQTLGDEEAFAALAEKFERLRSFITNQFSEAALNAIAGHVNRDDAETARLFLNSDTPPQAAVQIICEVGDGTDVESLLRIARTSYGRVEELALEGVRRLATEKLSTATRLLEMDASAAKRVGLALAADVEGNDAIPFFSNLLSHASTEVRQVAILELGKRLNRQQLADLLEEYVARPSYFYNVVVWLDRILYAPPEVLQEYQNKVG